MSKQKPVALLRKITTLSPWSQGSPACIASLAGLVKTKWLKTSFPLNFWFSRSWMGL